MPRNLQYQFHRHCLEQLLYKHRCLNQDFPCHYQKLVKTHNHFQIQPANPYLHPHLYQLQMQSQYAHQLLANKIDQLHHLNLWHLRHSSHHKPSHLKNSFQVYHQLDLRLVLLYHLPCQPSPSRTLFHRHFQVCLSQHLLHLHFRCPTCPRLNQLLRQVLMSTNSPISKAPIH